MVGASYVLWDKFQLRLEPFSVISADVDRNRMIYVPPAILVPVAISQKTERHANLAQSMKFPNLELANVIYVDRELK